jgi:phosphatidylserine/phosphatidylglycerophosphate/cardiolipin synthase-like enzyme
MRRALPHAVALAAALVAGACAPAAPEGAAARAPSPGGGVDREQGALFVELVESAPVETSLDHPDIPDAGDVWLEMIRGAKRRLDVEPFYVSNAPGSRLEPILQAIEAAADRGVAVRLLVDESFYPKYPDSVDRLAARRGIEVRRFDVGRVMGGVQHAKFFLVDDREAFVGSQNFDWRALSHIHEIGARVRVPEVVGALAEVFALDWALAGGGAPPGAAEARGAGQLRFPVRLIHAGAPLSVTPVVDPPGFLPDPSLWELPRLVALLDGARRSLDIEVMKHSPTMRDGSPFPDLDAALRRAAGRGVTVRLLVSDGGARGGVLDALRDLARVPHIAIKVVTLPAWSGGAVPYARLIHAKTMVVDSAVAWVGSSNWEGDYFTRSRNVGLVLSSVPLAAQLGRVFQDLWISPYAAPLSVDVEATSP